MRTELEEIKKAVNTFPAFYEMSDMQKVYQSGKSAEAHINNMMHSMSLYGQELKAKLELEGTEVDVFERYFAHVAPAIKLEPKEDVKPVVKQKSPAKVNLFKNAWQMVKSGLVDTMSEGLRLVWKKLKTVKAIKSVRGTVTTIKAAGQEYLIKPMMTVDLGTAIKVLTAERKQLIIDIQNLNS